MNEKNNHAPAWTTAHTFKDEETGLVVQVQKSDGYRPRFSFEIGREVVFAKDGGKTKFVRFINARTETVNAKVTLPRTSKVIAELVAKAEDYIQSECQLREDDILEEKIQREQAHNNRNKPKQHMGLKALSRRDKAVKTAGG